MLRADEQRWWLPIFLLPLPAASPALAVLFVVTYALRMRPWCVQAMCHGKGGGEGEEPHKQGSCWGRQQLTNDADACSVLSAYQRLLLCDHHWPHLQHMCTLLI